MKNILSDDWQVGKLSKENGLLILPQLVKCIAMCANFSVSVTHQFITSFDVWTKAVKGSSWSTVKDAAASEVCQN